MSIAIKPRAPSRRRIRKVVLLLILLVLAAAIILKFQAELLELLVLIKDRDALVQYARSVGYWGPVFMGAAIFLQILVAMIPGHPLLIASGYLYGFTKGFALSWTITVIATQVSFGIARFGGRPIIGKLIGVEQTAKWAGSSRFDQLRFYFLAFNLPIFPGDIMGYVGGLSKISPRRFLVANLMGRAPVPLVFAFVGSFRMGTFHQNLPMVAIALALVFGGWLIFRSKLRAPLSFFGQYHGQK